jgi:hypothetical protein
MLTGQHIDEHAVGDDFDIVRTITDVPSGVTITKAWLMVKENSADVDGSAIVTKTITTGTTTPGTVTDSGAGDGIGEVTFHMLTADTNAMDPLTDYVYGIKVQLSNGYTGHVEQGTIRLRHGIVAGEP